MKGPKKKKKNWYAIPHEYPFEAVAELERRQRSEEACKAECQDYASLGRKCPIDETRIAVVVVVVVVAMALVDDDYYDYDYEDDGERLNRVMSVGHEASRSCLLLWQMWMTRKQWSERVCVCVVCVYVCTC